MIIITTQCFFPKIGGIESLMTGMADAMSGADKDVLVLADGKKNVDDEKKKYKIKRFSGWKPYRRRRKAAYLKKFIDKYGSVSPQCFRSMLQNLYKLSKSKINVSITGIAGPRGGTKEKPVGLVYIGLKK